MDIKTLALIKSIVKGITKGERGEKGEPGLLRISTVSNPYEGYTLMCNCIYHADFSDNGVLAPAFDFDYTDDNWSVPADKDHERQIGVIFTMREDLTVGFPTNVHWAAAEPVFEAGKIYMLSFIPYDGIVIGVWAVVE